MSESQVHDLYEHLKFIRKNMLKSKDYAESKAFYKDIQIEISQIVDNKPSFKFLHELIE